MKVVLHPIFKAMKKLLKPCLLQLIKQALKQAAEVAIAMDPADSEMYDTEKKIYHFHKTDGKKLSSEEHG